MREKRKASIRFSRKQVTIACRWFNVLVDLSWRLPYIEVVLGRETGTWFVWGTGRAIDYGTKKPNWNFDLYRVVR